MQQQEEKQIMQQIKNLSNLTPAGKDVIKDTAAWKVKANSNAAETVKVETKQYLKMELE